jgi:hypothetical protein
MYLKNEIYLKTIVSTYGPTAVKISGGGCTKFRNHKSGIFSDTSCNGTLDHGIINVMRINTLN